MSLTPAFEIGLWNAWIFIVYYFAVFILWCAFGGVSKRGKIAELRYTKIEKQFVYISSFVWIILIIYTFFLPLKLGTPWCYVGIPLCLIGLIMYTIACINFATTPPDMPITKGLYRISRHPIYLVHDFIFIGIGIACASWIFLFLSAIYLIVQHILSIPEERFLEKYGDAYQEYMNRTPRYVGVSNKNKKEEVS